MHILICGAGLMARAIAFDLLHYTTVEKMTLIDSNNSVLDEIKKKLSSDKVTTIIANVQDESKIRPLFDAADIVISAAPYRFNYDLTKIAIASHSHFIDLGGNNDVVAKQRTLHEDAKAEGVTIIPDNGLAPGLVSVFVHDIVDQFNQVDKVSIRVGGVPQNPQPPLKYQLVFAIEGLINEYVEPALILDQGKIITKPSLTEIERIQFPEPYGEMEAFLTSGGCSTMPYTYRDKIGYMDYKTIRYPGHCEFIGPFFSLGMASYDPIDVRGTQVVPRDFFKAILKGNIPSSGLDSVIIQVKGIGKIGHQKKQWIYQIIDQFDTHDNFTAMQRMTGFPVAITAEMILSNKISDSGVFGVENVVPPKLMFEELKKRRINLTISKKDL
jgi:lysine 6-dehydrogenase